LGGENNASSAGAVRSVEITGLVTTRELRHSYHDAGLVSFSLGPRHELTLLVARPSHAESCIRFGAIVNFDEVSGFFAKLPRPPSAEAYLDRIESLAVLASSTARALRVALVLDHGGSVEITCSHLTESAALRAD
jgi:hypothetical protein